MANFVDYNGNNIEESLLVTDTSHGLISKENNLNYNDTYENRYNHGLCYIPNIQEQKVSTFRVYSRNKHPFIFIITYNLLPSIYIGTCYANDDNVTKPAKITIVATSSHYGGEFEGKKVVGQVGEGSTLWVDEFELSYE